MTTKLLTRLFLRDPENGDQSRLREQYDKLAGWAGVATNLVLFFIKLLAGLVFHNIVIVADTFDNLTDSASPLMTLFELHLPAKPTGAEHPYGHTRIECITGTVVSFLAAMVGFQLTQTSVGKVLDPHPTEFSAAPLIALITSVLLKVWQGLLYRKISRTIDSTALLVSSQNGRNDALSTGAILISPLISYFIDWQFDGWLGLGIAVFILVAGFRLVIETVNPLLSPAPSEEVVDDIYRKILPYPGIIGLHDLSIHNYGPDRCFASVHCEVCTDRSIVESHEITDRIEHDFLTDSDIYLVVHLDPVIMGDGRANRLKTYVEEDLRAVSDEITMHDFQAVWEPEDSHVIFDIVVPYCFSWSDEQLMEYLSEKIKSQEPQCESIITMDRDDSSPPHER